MIHTKQPANQFFVYATAYRAIESREVNEKFMKGMVAEIRKYPGLYGVIDDAGLMGHYREEGQDVATAERTVRVRCRNATEADNVAFLACDRYNQDAVLEVTSQLHTATLVSYKREGVHSQIARSRTEIGTLTEVKTPQGECYTYEPRTGKYWEVL